MNYKQEFENTMVELLKKAWHEGEAEGIRRAEAEYNKGYEQGLNDAWECAKLDKIEQDLISPCDSCRYNPPGSGDGKPCTMCPADATERFREKVERGYFRKRKEV